MATVAAAELGDPVRGGAWTAIRSLVSSPLSLDVSVWVLAYLPVVAMMCLSHSFTVATVATAKGVGHFLATLFMDKAI